VLVDNSIGADSPRVFFATLSRIAEHQCRKLPDAPPEPAYRSDPVTRSWFRRPDALVAALLLIIVGGFGSSYLLHLWRNYQTRLACQDNLREIGKGLLSYCDHHNGEFPRVEENGPHGVAGFFVPALYDNGVLGSAMRVNCPAQKDVPAERYSTQELEELYQSNPDEFRRVARRMAGGYAYSLGYRDSDGHHGLRCNSGDRLPILADGLESLDQSNSPNHGGEGQNVLYLGGTVEWHTNRKAGVDLDDIFVNWDNQVLAGKAWKDTVLGLGDASPTPREK